jgi:hypothetical protein
VLSIFLFSGNSSLHACTGVLADRTHGYRECRPAARPVEDAPLLSLVPVAPKPAPIPNARGTDSEL